MPNSSHSVKVMKQLRKARKFLVIAARFNQPLLKGSDVA